MGKNVSKWRITGTYHFGCRLPAIEVSANSEKNAIKRAIEKYAKMGKHAVDFNLYAHEIQKEG